jgi:hypothetical protein
LNASFGISRNVSGEDYESSNLSKYLLLPSLAYSASDLSYTEPYEVKVEERPLPTIKHPDDVLVKVTTAAICGSDLHMYQGRTAAQGGLCFGANSIVTAVHTSDDLKAMRTWVLS